MKQFLPLRFWLSLLISTVQQSPKAVDFAAVKAKVAEIQALAVEKLGEVKSLASADNEQVGSDIAVKIDEAAAVALEILAKANAEVDAETLTADSAKAYLKELEVLLLTTQADLTDHVNQLSQSAQDAIRATFYAAYSDAKALAEELYALLNALAKSSRAVDFAAVKAKVAEIQALAVEKLGEVKSLASADNEEVGSSIAAKIDEAAAVALEILAKANAEVDAETLTADSAKVYLKDLEALLLSTQADLTDFVNQLSQSAQDAIRATFYAAYTDAKVKAEELYALLEQ